MADPRPTVLARRAAGITDERLAVAVRLGNTALADAINVAQGRLADRGDLARLGRRWFGDQPGGTEILG